MAVTISSRSNNPPFLIVVFAVAMRVSTTFAFDGYAITRATLSQANGGVKRRSHSRRLLGMSDLLKKMFTVDICSTPRQSRWRKLDEPPQMYEQLCKLLRAFDCERLGRFALHSASNPQGWKQTMKHRRHAHGDAQSIATCDSLRRLLRFRVHKKKRAKSKLFIFPPAASTFSGSWACGTGGGSGSRRRLTVPFR